MSIPENSEELSEQQAQQPASGQEAQANPAPVRPAPAPRPPFVPREERDRRRREALAGLAVGEWREGKVTGIAAFGAFVDLGGVDGLVHVSQLGAGGFVERVEDVVQVGQVVRVRIVEVDTERNRVSLSMREPRPSSGPAGPRDRPAATTGAPRPSRSTPAPGAGTPGWTEPPPEQRPDRRRNERSFAGRGEERPRRTERPRRARDTDDEEWRSVRGDARGYYSGGEEAEEEPAPTTAEELVARFGKRGTNR